MTWWPSEERNGNNSWNAMDGWKEFSQSTQLWKDGVKLEPWILKRMEQDLRETLLRSSNVENDDEKHHHELLALRNEEWKGWANDAKNLKDLREIHMTDDESFLHQTLKDLRIAPVKLEESGKILGKDLWVRAHSKETPLKWFKRENAPVELEGLNTIGPRNSLNGSRVETRIFEISWAL